MSKVDGAKKLFSNQAQKKFGKPFAYGMSIFGLSNFGSESVDVVPFPFGFARFGVDGYGDFFQFSGIYQRRQSKKGSVFARLKYYTPKNPRSIPQQTNRGKIASAVLAWQALSDNEKKEYNRRALGRQKSGYNLFIRWFLLQ